MPSAQVLQALRLLIARHMRSQPTRFASRSEYQIAFQPPPLFMVFMAEILPISGEGRQHGFGLAYVAIIAPRDEPFACELVEAIGTFSQKARHAER